MINQTNLVPKLLNPQPTLTLTSWLAREVIDTMGGGKNRVNVIVDDEAKENLANYQRKAGLKTRDDTVEAILHSVPKWQTLEAKNKTLEGKIQALEARLKEAGIEP
jgi:hypothetical protein